MYGVRGNTDTPFTWVWIYFLASLFFDRKAGQIYEYRVTIRSYIAGSYERTKTKTKLDAAKQHAHLVRDSFCFLRIHRRAWSRKRILAVATCDRNVRRTLQLQRNIQFNLTSYGASSNEPSLSTVSMLYDD